MTQQKPYRSEDDVYKRTLFYDNGIRFVEVKGRMVKEYTPPTPVTRSNVNKTLQGASGLVQRGTSHYQASVSMLFYSKAEFADWLQHIGFQHKYYDEKGSIFVGVVTGEPSIETVEMESKYMVSVNLILIRKQEFELRNKSPFIDTEEHWAKEYIDEMQQRGLISTYDSTGEPVQYFRPEKFIQRHEATAFLTRTFRHLDKVLRGY